MSDMRTLLLEVGRLLNIERPLVAFDIEATGVNPDYDRIVELSIGRVEPGEQPGVLTTTVERWLVNPGVPIPKEASDVHGITDADVATAPRFKAIAARVYELMAGADLVGYNHRRFDVRMIAAECSFAGLGNPCEGARMIDVGLIFQKREPRTLSAALQFFCGKAHEGAHGAEADVVATLQVLAAQFDRYVDLPRDIDALDALNRDPSFVDREGKIVWRGGRACIGFGKYNGVPLEDVDVGFLRWMLDRDFPADTKEIARAALRGEYPAAPAAPVEATA